MTPDQRQQLFLAKLDELQTRFGVQLKAQIVTRQYGTMLQHEPQIVIEITANWQPTVNTVSTIGIEAQNDN